MGHDISFPIDLPEDPAEWTIAETPMRGARRAWLMRHPLGTDVLLCRIRQTWTVGIGRPSLMPDPDGGSTLQKTFYDDISFPSPPNLRRGQLPVGLALRLLSAYHGGRARRLVAFLRVCVRLHALNHGAEISHVSQEIDRRMHVTFLRPHAVTAVIPRIALPEDVATALARALRSAHGIPTPLATGMYDSLPTTAHGCLARRQALLAEAEILLDPDLPGARALLDQISELCP